MKRNAVLPLLWLILGAAPVSADDFDDAAATYQSGDYAAALSQFMPLAEAGDPRAQTIVAMMYKYGEAVEQSWEEAFKWYETAAEAGYVPAQFQVGDMYASGHGVAQDRNEAIRWLTLAAENGFAKANDRLAELNAHVVDMEVETEELIAWSQAWKLHLPVELRRSPPAPPPVERVTPPESILYRVQLGAMGSRAAAHALWDSLGARTGNLFDGMQPVVVTRRDVSGKVLYAVQTGPFANQLAAARFCENLASRGVMSGCLPLRSSGETE